MPNAHETEQIVQAYSCAQASVLLRVDVVSRVKASNHRRTRKDDELQTFLVIVSHVRLNQVHHANTLHQLLPPLSIVVDDNVTGSQ
jgi:hypothetical protein